jgi:hypothetical protein
MSAPTAIVSALGQAGQHPSNGAPPVVYGSSYVGGRLQASQGAWVGATPLSYRYQWQRCRRRRCVDIRRATRPWYTPGAADFGEAIRVLVTVANRVGRARAASTATAATGPSDASIRSPIAKALIPAGRTSRIAALSAAGGYTTALSVSVRGTVSLQWFYVPKGARLGQVYGKVLPVLVATGGTRVRRGRNVTCNVRLTAAGERLLEGVTTLKLTGEATFTASGRPTVVALRTFSLSG